MRKGPGLLPLVENETLKVIRRKRFHVVAIVLASILTVVVLAQNNRREQELRDAGSADFRPAVERRIREIDRRLSQRRLPEGFARFLEFEGRRLRYYLEKGLDPNALTGPLFTRGFAGIGSVLLFPLLVAVVASDLVSSEVTEGTIKLLLTRPVPRRRILAGKLIAMALFTTLILLSAAFLAWAISGFAFSHAGWGAPILNGFRSGPAGFDVSAVRVLPLWVDSIAAWGLAWVAAISVGCVTVLLSVLFRAPAAAMGTMMATLIAGTVLSRVASDWEPAKWFFVTNLPLPEFYAGVPPPYPGMTPAFSTAVLIAWGAAATAIALIVFVRRDVAA